MHTGENRNAMWRKVDFDTSPERPEKLRMQEENVAEFYANMDEEPFLLNREDPFENAVISIVEMNRKKRQDYAEDGDPFSNFNDSAYMLGMKEFRQREAVLFNIVQKVARLKSLRRNGRMEETANESVMDTYLDLAVYSVILYALAGMTE